MSVSRSYLCWRDEDGYHVWQRHVCGLYQRTEKLPAGPQGWGAPGIVVIPSINCLDCGLHVGDIPISDPPADWSGGSEFLAMDGSRTSPNQPDLPTDESEHKGKSNQ